jgi:hypothetical protein
MVAQMDPSDANAVRRLLTATQRFAARAEEARRQQEATEYHGYRYRFDDFENFDEDSDDERDFRDLSHYTMIDNSTGRVTELWLGIIDVHGVTSNNNADDDARHWKLSDDDWKWLSQLDRLEHFKVTGCGALPHRQLKDLRHLKHISCSECGSIASGANVKDNEEDSIDLDLPQVRSVSLRCGFQPNPAGVESLRAMFRYIRKHLTNLERITIWRLDQQQWRGQISSTTTTFQRKQYRRDLVETLLEELSGCSSFDNAEPQKTVKTLELNRCGLTSADFRRLMFEILPKNFPSLQRLSLSSNEIDKLPEIQNSSSKSSRGAFEGNNNIGIEDDEPGFSEKKHLFRRLRKSLQQIHLSNNQIMEFLGKNGEEHKQLVREGIDGTDENREQEIPNYRDEHRRREEEDVIVLRRFRRIKELEKLRDWLRLFPKLSQLGYVSCVHNLMRSTTGDFTLTWRSPAAPFQDTNKRGNGTADTTGRVVPFLRYSKFLQRQIEYYLRVNRGGRWLIDGGGCCGDGREEGGFDDDENNRNSSRALLRSLALWPNILEWSYRTSSSGCFLVPLPGRQERPVSLHLASHYYPVRSVNAGTSSHKNATALYSLLREGPALCDGARRECSTKA